MDDKELLELAAKAAGIENLYWSKDGEKLFRRDGGIQKPWNPLTNDGDALRLAVKLHINMSFFERDITCHISGIGMENCPFEQHGNDPYAATRRAIVRAAAEIGKGMK